MSQGMSQGMGSGSIIQRQWRQAGARMLFEVSVTGLPAGDVESETRVAIETALHEIRTAGFDPGHLARSRLWCRDATSRRAASDVRRDMLVGPLRSASASFFDAERLPAGSNVRIDMIAVAADVAASVKSVREYEPAIAPPMYVAWPDVVFLSGNTDESPHFHTQVAMIREKIDKSLQAANASLVDACACSVYLAKSIETSAAFERLAHHFGDLGCAIDLHTVEGYSAPAKRVEIEITALRR